MAPKRSGERRASALRVSAGTIASSSGSASGDAQPAQERPCGTAHLLVMNMVSSPTASVLLRRVALTLHLKRRALDDAEHDRRKPVVLAPRCLARSRARPACRSTEGRGRARRSSASRSRCRRTARGSRSSAWRSVHDAVDLACRRAAAPIASIGVPGLDVSRQAPTASKFSSAKPSGSMILWQPRTAGFARCSSIRSRIVCGAAPGSIFVAAARSRGGRRRRAEQVLEHPLAAQRPGRCGRRATSPSGCRPCRAVRAARIVGQASRAGSGCRRRSGCRSAARAARSTNV